MIFGFNTDVRCGETRYHVQSEPRAGEDLVETQVFVSGRCIGIRATSYAVGPGVAASSEEQVQELLKAQHRLVVEAARRGLLQDVLEQQQPAPASELTLLWLNADSIYAEHAMVMRFQVTDGAHAVEGASLTSRIHIPQEPPIYTQAVTDASGTAEMKIHLDQDALRDAAVLVQATHAGRSATRKFRLRKS